MNTVESGPVTPGNGCGSGFDLTGLFVGSEGMMVATYGNYQLLPEQQYADFQPPEKSIPDSIGHHAEWIKGCKDRTATTCHFGYSGPLTETVLLGNVAYRSQNCYYWRAGSWQKW